MNILEFVLVLEILLVCMWIWYVFFIKDIIEYLDER